MALDNRYLTVAYRLYTIEDGEEDEEPIEVYNRRRPFEFISNLNVVLPAFDKNVGNLSRGDEFDFIIPCKDAYGEFHEELMFDVDQSIFMIDGKLDFNYIYEGAVVPMQGVDGSRFLATIIEIKKDTITIDLNNPRAGQDLHFVGHVIDSRPATNEEIAAFLNSMSECAGCESGCNGGCGGCGSGQGGKCGGCQ